jgi:hypothetical protein
MAFYIVFRTGSYLSQTEWDGEAWAWGIYGQFGPHSHRFETYEAAAEYARYMCFHETRGASDDFEKHSYRIVER